MTLWIGSEAVMAARGDSAQTETCAGVGVTVGGCGEGATVDATGKGVGVGIGIIVIAGGSDEDVNVSGRGVEASVAVGAGDNTLQPNKNTMSNTTLPTVNLAACIHLSANIRRHLTHARRIVTGQFGYCSPEFLPSSIISP